MLLANNVLLLAAAGSVLLGTLYPLFLDALNLGKISVGPPYFDTVFVPLMTPLVFLMGVGPLARWKQAELPDLARRLRWALAVSVVTALARAASPPAQWKPLACLRPAARVLDRRRDGRRRPRARAQRRRGARARSSRRQPRSYWGMVLAHLGIAVFIVGVTMVKGYETERDVKMNVGDTVTVGGLRVPLRRRDASSRARTTGPRAARSRSAATARTSRTLYPEKRQYNAGGMPMTNAAIDSGLFGDIYVSMGEPVDGGAWIIRVYSKPFITWVWGGFVLMALGGFLALSRPPLPHRRAKRDAALPRGAAAAR